MTEKTCGEALMHLLEGYGVTTVFGIPGEHSLELYRGIESSNVRHVTPRNEQGAGFMADGYGRATGEPGVCTIITGPGVTNAATAIGQAYADSIPMLVRNPDLIKLADAYGCPGILVDSAAAFEATFRDALRYEGPTIIMVMENDDWLKEPT